MAYESQFIKAWCSCDALESVGICKTSTKWEHGLLLPTDAWAYVYTKCRGTWSLRLTLCWTLTAQVRDTYIVVSHCSYSCWGVSGSFCHDYSILKCFPTYLLRMPQWGERRWKTSTTHTVLPTPSLQTMPGQAHPTKTSTWCLVEQSSMGSKSNRNVLNTL